jgi:hypothetical protein
MNLKKSTLQKYFSKQNIIIVSLLVCLLSISFLNFTLFFYEPPKIAHAKVDPNSAKIEFWNNFLILHPKYFEGWIELCNLELKSGNLEAANVAYANAFQINPNSEELKILRLKLGFD